MAISDKITSIQNHLKDDWDSVESLIGDTELDKNIENISSALDDLYNDLPKVTGSGTSITLDDTRKGRLESTLSGNTSQTTYSGKNLLDTSFITGKTLTGLTITNTNGLIKITGTATEGTNLYYAIDNSVLGLQVGETYTLSAIGTLTGLSNLGFKKTGTDRFVVDYNRGDTSKTLTVTESSLDYNQFSFWVPSGNVVNASFYLQLESGSSATSYEPFVGKTTSPNPSYPQPINVVSGDNEINVCGKNLFDKDNLIANYRLGSDGAPFYQCGYSLTEYISVEPNTNYCRNIALAIVEPVCLYDSSKTFISRITTGSSFTTTSETKYIRTAVSTDNINITQLEKGSSASTYEPYQGNTYNIDLPVENLFDISTNTNGKVIASDGTITDDSKFTISDYIKVSPSTIYTISWVYDSSQGSDTAMRVACYQSDKTFISRPYNTTSPYVITTPNNCYYIRICYHLTSHTQVQVEKGSKTNSYTPYGTTPIELGLIGTYKDNFLRTSGKNLYDGLYTAKRYINYNTGEMRTSDDWSATDYIEIEPNTSYTLSGITNSGWTAGTSFYDSGKTFISSVYSTTYTFTTPTNAKYLRLSLNSETPINIILNEGTTALPYEPYGTGEWYWKKRIEKANLKDKSIGLQSINSYNIANFLVQPIETDVPDTSLYNYSLCNRFSVQTTSIADTQTEGFLRTLNGGIRQLGVYIRISSDRANTVETFKAWLGNNPTYYYWVLYTPTYIKITYEPLLEQLEAYYHAKSRATQTNISQENNDLPFEIDASALKEWSV